MARPSLAIVSPSFFAGEESQEGERFFGMFSLQRTSVQATSAISVNSSAS